MYCSKCGNPVNEGDRFCIYCGNCLIPDVEETAPVQPVKKGSRRTPWLFIVLTMIVGIAVFILFPTAPAVTASAEMPWFSMNGNTLVSFDPALYEGSSELTIPETLDGVSVLHIGGGCFAGCDSLTTVILPEKLQTIGDRAFWECSALRGIAIPNTVSTIGAEAFYGCGELEAVYLSGGITAIGEGCFEACGGLLHIYFDGTLAQWDALYTGYITPFTQVYASDGVKRHVGAR